MFGRRKGKRRFLRIRLTVPGWATGITLGLTFGAALNSGINLFYMLAAALFSLLLVSLGISLRVLRGVHMSNSAPRATHRMEEVTVPVSIENRKWLLPTASIRIESDNAPGETVGYMRVLPARERASARVREVFKRRGLQRLPRYTLVTSFPFGLIEVWRGYPSTGEILVYPRVNSLRTNAAEQSAGSRYRSRSVAADGDEFFSIREYLPGDDIRRISWRASARRGKLMVRELSRQNSRFILFLFDTRREESTAPPDYEENFEEAVELIASLGVTLLERQYNVSVECPQGHLESGEGSGQKRRLMDFLAHVQPVRKADYPVFDEHHCKLDTQLPTLLLIHPDPNSWGGYGESGSLRVLDPREVIHAT